MHIVALATLLALPHSALPTEEPDERVLLSSIVRIQPAPRPQPHVARSVARPVERRPQATPPPLHATVATEHAHRPLVVAAENRYVPRTAPATVQQQPAPADARAVTAPNRPVPATSTAAVPSAAPAATRAPVAVAAATVAPAAAEREMGMGNFGETYPARPVPGLLDALRTKVPHLVARISVDERGRATNVALLSGTDDVALRDEITRALLAATYIPASCNGLSCSETFELRT